MTTAQPNSPTPAIAQDLPCITCGYNLRGLAPSGLCPECGTPIQRSIDARVKLIMASPKVWARMVLGGVVGWLLLTPYFLGVTLRNAYSDVGRLVQWLNFPGPKVWFIPVLQQTSFEPQLRFQGILPIVATAIMAVLAFLMTWPRHSDNRLEPAISVRAVARWVTVAMLGGTFMLGIMRFPDSTRISPVLGTFAIGLNELPCTFLMYLYMSNLARQLDLHTEAIRLRVVMWIGTGAIVVALAMAGMDFNTRRIDGDSLAIAFFWCCGAIVGTAAVGATGSLIRVAMALWPIAAGQPVQTSR